MERIFLLSRFICSGYLDEQVFRYNNRATKKQFISDYDRFCMVTDSIIGKRITYQELIGRGIEEAQAN
jgi:hypothetical protein